jgi:TorA maturation chaperone TorD
MEAELRAALADDLEQLIRLNDRELDAPTLAALVAAGFPSGLALMPAGEAGDMACTHMAEALAAIPQPPAAGVIDELAADYAAIYLNNALGASPYESVWLDDDHLACQQPMFELREIYAAAGLQASDWRSRFDDHFVLQLQHLRHGLLGGAVDGEKMANFIDEHVGYWFPGFARRVSEHCRTPFYAAVAELTHVWLLAFRALLDEMYGLPVPAYDEMTERINRKLARDKADIAPIRFFPGGQGPSW